MRARLLEILRCPGCGRSLAEDGQDLVCGNGHHFPVVQDLPRMVDARALPADQRDTADAFGYSWSNYPAENPYTEEQWRDWVVPLGESDFAGRLVLDAGCGLGGFANYALRWGARQVVGVDLSRAIDAAHQYLGDRIDFAQADIYTLPFAPATFDLAYSIGVLHHLPDPERGFRSVANAVRPGGTVFAWVYGRENNGWIVRVVDPLRKHALPRLPRVVVKWAISYPLAGVLMLGVRAARRGLKVPYAEYLRWLGKRDLAFAHGVVFDHLVAPTTFYVNREEFEGWFRRAGLVDVRITWRNRNSWRGVGRVPQSNQPVAPPARLTATG